MSNRDENWLIEKVGFLLSGKTTTETERPVVTLDEIGDSLGTETVGADDVEALIQALQAAGAVVGNAEGEELVSLLKVVIKTAHELRREGERPHPQKIAERAGLTARGVKVALLYAEVLKG